MRQCQVCHEGEAIYAWQPFGPAEEYFEGDAFLAPGHHYRGFPVIKVCGGCQEEIASGIAIQFSYQGIAFEAIGSTIQRKGK